MSVFVTALLNWCPFVSGAQGTTSVCNEEMTVFTDSSMQTVVPKRPLIQGSVQICPLEGGVSEKNSSRQTLDVHTLIKKIVRCWESKGPVDYLVYQKITDDPQGLYKEIVPYNPTKSRLWQEIKVLWHIGFGGVSTTRIDRQKVLLSLQKSQSGASGVTSSQKRGSSGGDVFCSKSVIDTQCVFEGKEINVLYNYAPIVGGEQKLHFLLVPKQHRERLTELFPSEYCEVVKLSRRIAQLYQKKGYSTVYVFDKNGASAGQTVFHWHEHVVIPEVKRHPFWDMVAVVRNILFGATKLSHKELQKRVMEFRQELTCLADE